MLFVIAKPDVYKSTASDTFIVFGEAVMEDMGTPDMVPSMEAQRAYQQAAAAVAQQLASSNAAAAEAAAEPVEGIEEKDIELVMQQAGVDRAKAIFALQGNDNDIVNAIMELTM